MARTPKKWTQDEDDVLRREVAAQSSEGEVRDWCQIAEKLPGRTNKDCRKRWHNTMAGEFRKGQWTRTEDDQLLRAVERHGQRWTVVATAVSSRSAEQCAKRWQQSLNPELDRSEWTYDEDQRLMEDVKAIGRQWTQIQRMHFPDRSKNAIKNRYTIVSRKLRKQAQRLQNENQKPGNDTLMEDASVLDSDDDGSDDGESEFGDRDARRVSTFRPGSAGADYTLKTSSHGSPTMSNAARSNSWTQFDQLIAGTQPFIDPAVMTTHAPDPLTPWMWDPTLPTPMAAEPTTDTFDHDLANLDLIMPDTGSNGSIVSDSLGFVSAPALENNMAPPETDTNANAVTVKLTLDNPNAETMQSLMKIAIENKAKFRVERD